HPHQPQSRRHLPHPQHHLPTRPKGPGPQRLLRNGRRPGQRQLSSAQPPIRVPHPSRSCEGWVIRRSPTVLLHQPHTYGCPTPIASRSSTSCRDLIPPATISCRAVQARSTADTSSGNPVIVPSVSTCV